MSDGKVACPQCNSKNEGECLAGIKACFKCGKSSALTRRRIRILTCPL